MEAVEPSDQCAVNDNVFTVDNGISSDSKPAISKISQSVLKLDVRRIQLRWDDLMGEYVARDDLEREKKMTMDTSQPYIISVVRRFVPTGKNDLHTVTEEIHIHSPQIVNAAKEVMKGRRNINWEENPLKFDPNDLLASKPRFLQYLKEQDANADMVDHLSFLDQFLEKEYRQNLQELKSLISAKQVTFNCIWGILIPGSILRTRCEVTGDPCAVRLVEINLREPANDRPRHYELVCEYADVIDGRPGLSQRIVIILQFTGAKRIKDLTVFPLEPRYIEDYEGEVQMLIDRGQKRCKLTSHEWCHMQYNAIAFRRIPCSADYRKVFVKSRVILDRGMFDQYADYPAPYLYCDLDGETLNLNSRTSVEHDEFLLMAPILYGYSLSDKSWFEFRVMDVNDIEWQPDMFDQLERSDENKKLMTALIESHCKEAKELDFVQGKGVGLVFNLHGPPGVGKTLTAEVTSEVTRRPLYTVSAGDLGTLANELDRALTVVFALAFRWKAVVLIDEADVFLVKRDIGDIVRNAMVSVFLRQLEYYPGILFLTTNRVEVFDPAMVSRIHVSLSYEPLDSKARGRLWSAFLSKANFENSPSPAQMKVLRDFELNGREIKNTVKIASMFASHKGRPMKFEDITRAFGTLGLNQARIVGENSGVAVINEWWSGGLRTYAIHSLVFVLLAVLLAVIFANFSIPTIL